MLRRRDCEADGWFHGQATDSRAIASNQSKLATSARVVFAYLCFLFCNCIYTPSPPINPNPHNHLRRHWLTLPESAKDNDFILITMRQSLCLRKLKNIAAALFLQPLSAYLEGLIWILDNFLYLQRKIILTQREGNSRCVCFPPFVRVWGCATPHCLAVWVGGLLPPISCN